MRRRTTSLKDFQRQKLFWKRLGFNWSNGENLEALGQIGLPSVCIRRLSKLTRVIEQAYACVLLTLTNYGPPSHNVKFLRSLAEEQDLRLVDAFPRDHHRQRAWFNTINEAYVKARYSKHFEISEEALVWLGERTAHLLALVKVVCDEHIQNLERDVSRAKT